MTKMAVSHRSSEETANSVADPGIGSGGRGRSGVVCAREHNAIMPPPPRTNKGADLGFCSEGWYAAARTEMGLDHPSKGVPARGCAKLT